MRKNRIKITREELTKILFDNINALSDEEFISHLAFYNSGFECSDCPLELGLCKSCISKYGECECEDILLKAMGLDNAIDDRGEV